MLKKDVGYKVKVFKNATMNVPIYIHNTYVGIRGEGLEPTPFFLPLWIVPNSQLSKVTFSGNKKVPSDKINDISILKT